MPKRRNYDAVPACSMEAALNLINGRWKGVILFHLMTDGTTRFNELQRRLPGCTPRLLSKQLRELEDDGFVHREVYAVVPPKVEYSLTEEGRSIGPILLDLCSWGRDWLKRRGLTTLANDVDETPANERRPHSEALRRSAA
ncbi:helix-turn-helix transcriptional regulator [Rhizobium leguminosarum]|uniref:winged helix-turn-helix transcriptional regulator n=1 Tax=Rhizobium TaxID=379 RepID=UPI001C90328C|nr:MULTISPECIES: helix-turn-helix domain-containing protein [Rhizobium]MBY3122563.1 helix-turn-helix transcriptional regulator [Rhizobium laguerreae]MBY3178687.1 helix-turn-helix transcriptional regulator [Rhizobium leguminosarum]MBY5565476.1 helix-turn-helix transcriptional regulator [Rhizobium leguminosarum]MBY5622179.1 helix-turn-helix transcriptional regulator [Rhizobium leguminosarum]MBY5693336.1 helix-turn-helix transcriptional regulator [Rhizobium leguminosarum]